jgi:hypothetical protein
MKAKPNCERIGKSHDYEVIGVQHVSPYNTDLVITPMPKDAVVRYSPVTYECKECADTRELYLPRQIAEREKQSQEGGNIGLQKYNLNGCMKFR